MKMRNILLATAASSLMATVGVAHAGPIGIGGNIGLSTGAYEDGNSQNNGLGVNDAEFEGDAVEFGFTLNVGQRNAVFNYRLNVNYVDGEFELDDNRAAPGNTLTVDYNGLMLNNNFAFRLMNSDTMRFWAGPTVFLAFIDGDAKGTLVPGSSQSVDGAGFGVGGVIGVDFFTSPTTDMGIEAGYRIAGYNLEPDAAPNSDFELGGSEGFIKANVIFRLNR